jgi:hypothetical protein
MRLMRSGSTFLGAEGAAMGAVAADLSAGEHYFKSEVGFHLFAHFLKGLAEIFFDFSAAQADDVRVFLLEAGFIIMLIAGMMHEVQLVNQPALFEEFERPVDRDAIKLGILFLGKAIETFSVEVQAGIVDQIEQDAALPSQPDATLAKGVLDTGGGHSYYRG